MYRFDESSVLGPHNGNIVLGNKCNGKWIMISLDKYSEIMADLDSMSDEYIKSKYLRLIETGIIGNETSSYKQEKIESLMIAITNRCNLECVHCGFSAGPSEIVELETELVCGLIKSNQDISEIIITGGEPLVHSGITKIIGYLKEYFNGKKILMTNGTLINSYNAKMIIETFDEISISIDGASEISCDKMRGRGVYKKVMTTIQLLKENGARTISLSMTITDCNRNEEKTFIDLCNRLGVEPIIRDLFAIGRAKENIEILNKNKKFDFNQVFDPELECKKIKMHGRCNAGRKSVYVQFDKKIYPCPVAAIRPEFEMGSIDKTKMDINRWIDYGSIGLTNFSDITPEKVEHCKDCDVNKFCWGCLQEYYTFIEDAESLHMFCEMQRKYLNNSIWRDV